MFAFVESAKAYEEIECTDIPSAGYTFMIVAR
jgi:hypothetical protein